MEKIKKNLISTSEFEILRLLHHKRSATLSPQPTTEVNEISQATGIGDSDEVLRALYTLEGKSLVQPEPHGDLTSNHWLITDVGIKAFNLITVP